jgi:hypothetical protein
LEYDFDWLEFRRTFHELWRRFLFYQFGPVDLDCVLAPTMMPIQHMRQIGNCSFLDVLVLEAIPGGLGAVRLDAVRRVDRDEGVEGGLDLLGSHGRDSGREGCGSRHYNIIRLRRAKARDKLKKTCWRRGRRPTPSCEEVRSEATRLEHVCKCAHRHAVLAERLVHPFRRANGDVGLGRNARRIFDHLANTKGRLSVLASVQKFDLLSDDHLTRSTGEGFGSLSPGTTIIRLRRAQSRGYCSVSSSLHIFGRSGAPSLRSGD